MLLTRSARAPNKLTNVRYPHRLQLYDVPPELELSIEDFEAYALDRLQLLKTIETAKVRNKRDEELKLTIMQTEDKFLPLHFNSTVNFDLQQERRKDHISHFILRLAYCRTEELRRWFLAQECVLFKYRLEAETSKDLTEFVQINQLNYSPIPDAEKSQISDSLSASSFLKNITNEDFYKVSFEECPDLVANRKVFVSGGFAYVPSSELIALITNAFRAKLSQALVITAKNLPHMEEDERLMPILTNIGKQNIATHYTINPNADTVNADAVDSLVEHFPLCMKQLHEELRASNHLKYSGRLQYGLFLKGLGLSMAEALLFWRRAFAPKVPEDKFQKQYAYNVRYDYGQEGKRADFNPKSCMKIIMGNPPGPGDHHGCPFRHYSPENLRTTLRANNVPESSIADIIKLVDNQHYQIACTRYYEVTHKLDHQIANITHPNAYADLSMGKAPNKDHAASNVPA